MSFLLRLLRAVVSLRAPAAPEEAATKSPLLPEADKSVAKPALREPRHLLECSLKLRPLNKSHDVRPVNRGAFTRVIVNMKERVRVTGGFDKDAQSSKAFSKEPVSPDLPMRDLRSRSAPSKRRPALVLLPGGGEPDGNPRGALRDASRSWDGPDGKGPDGKGEGEGV